MYDVIVTLKLIYLKSIINLLFTIFDQNAPVTLADPIHSSNTEQKARTQHNNVELDQNPSYEKILLLYYQIVVPLPGFKCVGSFLLLMNSIGLINFIRSLPPTYSKPSVTTQTFRCIPDIL